MVHIAICEDTQADMEEACRHIRQYGARHNLPLQLHCFSTGEALLETLQKGQYQIVFMDVFLGRQSGVEVSRRIAAIDPDASLVFLTISPEYALEGYEVNAVHYLIKPVNPEKVAQAMERCEQKLIKHMRAISVRSGRTDISILLDNIEFLEVHNKMTTLHTRAGDVCTYTALDTLEKELGGLPFLRSHRFAIVNLQYVERWTPNGFEMHSGATVPIRRSGGTAARQQYFDFLFAKNRNEIE